MRTAVLLTTFVVSLVSLPAFAISIGASGFSGDQAGYVQGAMLTALDKSDEIEIRTNPDYHLTGSVSSQRLSRNGDEQTYLIHLRVKITEKATGRIKNFSEKAERTVDAGDSLMDDFECAIDPDITEIARDIARWVGVSPKGIVTDGVCGQMGKIERYAEDPIGALADLFGSKTKDEERSAARENPKSRPQPRAARETSESPASARMAGPVGQVFLDGETVLLTCGSSAAVAAGIKMQVLEAHEFTHPVSKETKVRYTVIGELEVLEVIDDETSIASLLAGDAPNEAPVRFKQ